MEPDGAALTARTEEANVTERNPADVLGIVESEGVEIVDLRFCDLPGLMQHFSVPAHQLTASAFEEGYGFDGSSIRGFQEIQESDMILMPDPNTAVIDPFLQHKTLDPQLLRPRPGHRRVLLPRPPLHRQEGRGVPAVDRHRRHRLLRARGRVLRLQRRALHAGPAVGVLPGRLRRGLVEHRHATKGPTSGTSRGTRRATSRSRRWTTSRTCARR